jgi:hypothetical protein
MDKEKRLKEIDKAIAHLGLIDSIPMIVLGLALHGHFAREGEAVLEVLNNATVVNMMFGFSIPVIVWCGFRIIQLSLEKRRIEKE